MNRFFTVCCQIMLLLGFALMYGCMSVEYIGQSFPALAESDVVKIYSSASPFPGGDYRVIGRVEIQAPDGTTQGDVREELTRLARKHGAEVVNILDFKRVRIGMVSVAEERTARTGWNRDGRNAGGDYIYSNYFGEVSTLKGRRSQVSELHIKAVLLVPGKKFKEMQAENRLTKSQPEKAKTEKVRKVTDTTTEEALEKSIRPVVESPVKPYKEKSHPERVPSSVELSADHKPAVKL